MSNRTLLISTALVIICMLSLLAFNLASVFTKSVPTETFLKYNDVKGMAVEYNLQQYTLNFKQQNEVIDILNRAVKIVEMKEGKKEHPQISQLMIYRFNASPLILTPITYIDNDLVFSVPEWESNHYLMEMSTGYLQQILNKSYDH